jgi:hypothetical protein
MAAQREHGWRWTAFVNGWWKGVGWGLFLLLLMVILFVHSSSTPAYAPAYEARQAKLHEANQALDYQEEQRQAEYAAHPGPPYPTKGWSPSDPTGTE